MIKRFAIILFSVFILIGFVSSYTSLYETSQFVTIPDNVKSIYVEVWGAGGGGGGGAGSSGSGAGKQCGGAGGGGGAGEYKANTFYNVDGNEYYLLIGNGGGAGDGGDKGQDGTHGGNGEPSAFKFDNALLLYAWGGGYGNEGSASGHGGDSASSYIYIGTDGEDGYTDCGCNGGSGTRPVKGLGGDSIYGDGGNGGEGGYLADVNICSGKDGISGQAGKKGAIRITYNYCDCSSNGDCDSGYFCNGCDCLPLTAECTPGQCNPLLNGEKCNIFGFWEPALNLEENCYSTEDLNCNGLIACEDPICTQHFNCQCYDLDDDGYEKPSSEFSICGLFDCDDNDGTIPSGTTELNCNDGKNNDCDDYTDCYDSDCPSDASCVPDLYWTSDSLGNIKITSVLETSGETVYMVIENPPVSTNWDFEIFEDNNPLTDLNILTGINSIEGDYNNLLDKVIAPWTITQQNIEDSEYPYEFYFKATSQGMSQEVSILTGGVINPLGEEIFSNDYTPKGILEVNWEGETSNICGDGTCSGSETCSTCETDCGPCGEDPCALITTCSDLTKPSCLNYANLECTITPEVIDCETPNYPKCGWNEITDVCESQCVIMDETGLNELGYCSYESSTTGDCSINSFLMYSLSGTWHPSSSFETTKTCASEETSIACPSQTKLPLTNFFGIILTIFVLTFAYLISSRKNK